MELMRVKEPNELEKIKQILGGIPYSFHCAEGFYILDDLQSDEEAIANAKHNPGTLKVINEITGDLIWELNKSI